MFIPSFTLVPALVKFFWQSSIHVFFEHGIDKVPYRKMTLIKTFSLVRFAQGTAWAAVLVAVQVMFLQYIGMYQSIIWETQGTGFIAASIVFALTLLLVSISSLSTLL